jgi:hypothetical protein
MIAATVWASCVRNFYPELMKLPMSQKAARDARSNFGNGQGGGQQCCAFR